jgi:hypothetical protein
MAEWMFYRGGPYDGQVQLGKHEHDGYLLFIDHGSTAYYRPTAEVVPSDRGPLPVAEYIGDHPPER